MKSIGKIAIVVWLCGIGIAAAQSGTAVQNLDESISKKQPVKGVIVLQNGQLIEGLVAERNDTWEVDTGGGTRLFLGKERVQFRCASRIDAYWELVARTKASDIDGQIKIVQFCIRYQLIAQAENQIDILQLMPIKASRLYYLHRQVQVAKAQEMRAIGIQGEAIARAKTERGAGPGNIQFRPLPPLNPVVATRKGLRATAPILYLPQPNSRFEENGVAQVGFEQPINSPNAKVAKRKSQVPTPRELDRLTDSLPKHTVAFFKRKIEPLLARSCFAAGCHGSDSNKMPIMRLAEMRVMPRNMSQRNLHSIMKFADPHAPLESTLLKLAATPHGGAEKAAVKPNSVPFNNLAQWLIGVSNRPNELHKIPDWFGLPKPIEAIVSTEVTEPPKDVVLPGEPEEPEIDYSKFKGLPAGLRLFDAEIEPDKPSRPVKKMPASENEPSVPAGRDPFDADVFNRKFGKKTGGK